jgi:hypothetical protein
MWGYVGGKVWQYNKKTGQWDKCNQATICANRAPVAYSTKGEYCFTLPGGTEIDSMTCDKKGYKQWIYLNVPFCIISNVVINIDIYMWPI